VTDQEWHGPNRFVVVIPAIVAMVIIASLTGWRDLRVAMVAALALTLAVTVVAALFRAAAPGTPRARYWKEFTVIHLWGSLGIGLVCLYACLDNSGAGLGGLVIISAAVLVAGWLIVRHLLAWRRNTEDAADAEAAEDTEGLRGTGGRPDSPLTDHLIKITAKGRGKDRQVRAECQECDWLELQTGRGDWPDRRVAQLAAGHSTRVTGAVRRRG
jgi:hypothetical protein